MSDEILTGGPKVSFHYRNWRGIESVRTVTPVSIRFGSSEYHPETQWLLRAYDHQKGDMRDFALADCNFTRTE